MTFIFENTSPETLNVDKLRVGHHLRDYLTNDVLVVKHVAVMREQHTIASYRVFLLWWRDRKFKGEPYVAVSEFMLTDFAPRNGGLVARYKKVK